MANCYTAVDQGLEVVPVLNKVDLPQAEPDRVRQEIEDVIGIDATDAIRDQRQDRASTCVRRWRPSSGAFRRPAQPADTTGCL